MARREHAKIEARSDGFGWELFNVYFGLPCKLQDFQGYYDLWPFCKPYDAEEWWIYEDKAEAEAAAIALTAYLEVVPDRIAPPRISFIEDATGFHLRTNGGICGAALYRGEDDKTPWPFRKLPDWANHTTRVAALKATIKLQGYLDGRDTKKAKTKKK